MGTKVFLNRRPPQTFTPPEPAPEPDLDVPLPPPSGDESPPPPKEAPAPVQLGRGEAICECGCGEVTKGGRFKRGHNRRTHGKKPEPPPKRQRRKHTRTHSAKKNQKPRPTRALQGDGFGLYICSNCKWFKTSYRGTDPCEKREGIHEGSKPCKRLTRAHGYFDPIETSPRVDELDLGELGVDELLLLIRRATIRCYELQLTMINKFKVGQRVKIVINKAVQKGVIYKLSTRHVIVLTDDDCMFTLRPREVSPDGDPLTAGQSN